LDPSSPGDVQKPARGGIKINSGDAGKKRQMQQGRNVH